MYVSSSVLEKGYHTTFLFIHTPAWLPPNPQVWVTITKLMHSCIFHTFTLMQKLRQWIAKQISKAEKWIEMCAC